MTEEQFEMYISDCYGDKFCIMCESTNFQIMGDYLICLNCGMKYKNDNSKESVDLLNELYRKNQDNEAMIEFLSIENTQIKDEVKTRTRIQHQLEEENEQLKKELKVYRKVASCSNCKYHNYDWDIDDGYGGDEYEVCDKGNDVTEGICEDWREL